MDTPNNEKTSLSILVPAPSVWPFMAAFALALVFTGVVTNPVVSIVGGVIFFRAAVGWWREVLPEQKEEAVIVTAADFAAELEQEKSLFPVEHLAGVGGHRAQLPLQIHPYWTGIYGGAIGGVAMAIIAIVFGLISQRSIWYPVNLLAAGIVPSLADAPIERLTHFSAAGLIAGAIIHSILSLFVGLLYAVSLPMFPRTAKWRSGLVTPVLWSGIVAATLGFVNPTLNARIEWGWFVGSQVAFGLACGLYIARTAKISVMQNWPLAERAGIEARNSEEEAGE